MIIKNIFTALTKAKKLQFVAAAFGDTLLFKIFKKYEQEQL